ncbi:MAG: MMPL family transporter [Gammaproteobacteria bacterium]|nr:MMPL family transporter [Gammaproteobacteria bacterium]
MKDWILDLSLKRPKQLYWFMALFTLVLAGFIPTIQIDTDPENMLPAQQKDRVFHNQIKKEFQLYDAIVVGVVNATTVFNPQTLKNIHQLTEQVLRIDGVVSSDVMSLSTIDNIQQEEQGTIRFEWMMKQAPSSQSKATEIEQSVRQLPLMLDTLVSADNKASAIYVPIKNKDESYQISKEIQQIADQLKGDDEYFITGLPVAEDTFGFQMFVQMGISAPMAAAMIFILMLFFFKNLQLVIAPMIVAMATVIGTMGLLIACGFTVHIMSSMIAIFLMPIAVVDSVHIMSEFADRFKPGQNAKQVAKEVVSHLFKPMLFTSVTSTVGFLSLALTPIPPVQIFGIFVGFGIMLAFIWTITFMPAYISRMSPEQLEKMQNKFHQKHENSVIDRLMNIFANISVRYSKILLLGFVGLFIFSMYGIQKIQINDNPVRWFKSDHSIRVADKVLNKHFAGTYDAFLVLSHKNRDALIQGTVSQLAEKVSKISNQKLKNELTVKLDDFSSQRISIGELIAIIDDAMFNVEGDDVEHLEGAISLIEETASELNYFTQPDTLNYMSELQLALQKTGLVGKTNAMTDLIKTVNRELKSGEASDYVLPETQAGIAQTLLQFQSSHRPQDLWHMVNPSYSRATIWIQLSSGDNQDMTRVIESVDKFVKERPLPEGMELQWAGKTYINVVWQEAMVAGMLDSLFSAFIVVMIMMIILFRSVMFGLLAMLPLTLTITFIYGLIGWIGKDYDMPIAVLSALTLGLSVDFAIHFIERARSIFNQTGDFNTTIKLMFEEPGRAITRNAIVIAIGFTPLLFAPLVPYITVGIFLASIMAASAIVTLLMLPSALNVLKRFLFNTQPTKGESHDI